MAGPGTSPHTRNNSAPSSACSGLNISAITTFLELFALKMIIISHSVCYENVIANSAGLCSAKHDPICYHSQPRRVFRVLEGHVDCRLHAEEPALETV